MINDVGVIFAPATVWPRAAGSASTGHWLSRYLLLMVVAGCSASLMTTGRVTLRIAVPCMVYTAVVPAFQLASLAAVVRGALPFRRAAELFAIGNLLWMAVLLVFAACWAWLPAAYIYGHFNFIRSTGVALVLVWSAYVDYWFFRVALDRSPLTAVRDLAVQRLLCWTIGLTLWVGPAGWQLIVSAIGQ